MKSRNTPQREIILKVVKEDITHPTIHEIYLNVSKIDRGIGQATVYRNVNKLVDEGFINRIPINDESLHYDGCCKPHSHLYCKKCHKIFDITNDYSKVVKDMEEKNTIKIEKINIIVEGLCNECNNECKLY